MNYQLRASAEAIEAALPRHEAECAIEHNPHRNVYETIETFMAGRPGDWVSAEERARAIAIDSLWVMQWYPATPIGFCRRAASSLGALLDDDDAPRGA